MCGASDVLPDRDVHVECVCCYSTSTTVCARLVHHSTQRTAAALQCRTAQPQRASASLPASACHCAASAETQERQRFAHAMRLRHCSRRVIESEAPHWLRATGSGCFGSSLPRAVPTPSPTHLRFTWRCRSSKTRA